MTKVSSGSHYYRVNSSPQFAAQAGRPQDAHLLVTPAQQARDTAAAEETSTRRFYEESLLTLASFLGIATPQRVKVAVYQSKATWHSLRKDLPAAENALRAALHSLESKSHSSRYKTYQVLVRLGEICEMRGERREAALLRHRAAIYHPAYGLVDEKFLVPGPNSENIGLRDILRDIFCGKKSGS